MVHQQGDACQEGTHEDGNKRRGIEIAEGKLAMTLIGDVIDERLRIEIPEEDIEMVANTAGVSAADAEEALRETGGDLAEAILKLNS